MAVLAASTSSSGTSFSLLLFVVFLVLKLTDVVAWSWLWVTSPLWIPAAIVLTVIAVVLSIGGTIRLLKTNKNARRL